MTNDDTRNLAGVNYSYRPYAFFDTVYFTCDIMDKTHILKACELALKKE